MSIRNSINRRTAIFGIIFLWANIYEVNTYASIIHYMIATDVNDQDIGKDMDINREFMRATVINNTPKNMFKLTVLSTKGITTKRILDTINDMSVNADDAIMFYYCGHGAYDEQKGTYILASGDGGRGLLHSTIRQAIEQKGVRFGLVILDCCNKVRPINGKPVATMPIPVHPEKISALFDNLFLQSNGTLSIISSARGEYALVYPSVRGGMDGGVQHRGSLYTITLSNTMDINRDNDINWDQLIQKHQRELNKQFHTVCRQGVIPLGDGTAVRQDGQTIVARWK